MFTLVGTPVEKVVDVVVGSSELRLYGSPVLKRVFLSRVCASINFIPHSLQWVTAARFFANLDAQPAKEFFEIRWHRFFASKAQTSLGQR